MKVSVLFSSGKDSSLSALILKRLGYEVELVTVNFGLLDTYKFAEETAKILGFDFRVKRIDKKILEKALEILVERGYPKDAINYLHKTSVEEVAKEKRTEAVADGTRRDDRVPMLSLGEVRSIEDRYNVEYIAPLWGLGYKTIKNLVNRFFVLEVGESESVKKADYEAELRELLRKEGYNVYEYFPKKHLQSRVVGVKVKI